MNTPNAHASPSWQLAQRLLRQGQAAEAAVALQEAIRQQPGHAEAHVQLGILLAQQGATAAAVRHFERAVEHQPNLAAAHQNLGVAVAERGDSTRALTCFQEALRLRPDYAEAAYNRGNILWQLGRADEAATNFRHALACQPAYHEALNNLGLLLHDRGEFAAAAVLLQQAVRLSPSNAIYHNNLALALAEEDRFPEALASLETALRLDPRYAEAHANLGNAWKDQGQTAAALACYDLALWLHPDEPSTRFNRALTWLQAGDYERGWPEFEWRWRRKQARRPAFREPAWDGSPQPDAAILLWAEQGLGDCLLFIRYAPLVKQRCRSVVLAVPPPLLPLLEGVPGVDRLIGEGADYGAVDAQAPLMSLPGLCRTTPDDVPAPIPYIQVGEDRAARWHERLAAIPGFKVGVCWQGNRAYKDDRRRSVAPQALAPLAAVPGVTLIDLQKKHSGDQPVADAGTMRLVELGPRDEADGAFVDTAAIMKALDLVVSVDTATGHLAGALGVPVWLALAVCPDWRWGLAGERTAWYPTMRLFRQTTRGDWPPVFERMAVELRKLVGRLTTIHIPVAPGELMDKISILRIKSRRMTDPAKLVHVRAELTLLEETWARQCVPEDMAELARDLEEVNSALWHIEDEIRLCELRAEFGDHFVGLARSVYQHNDRRAALKRRINDRLGAAWCEEKEYTAFKVVPAEAAGHTARTGGADTREQ